ncbi:MAG: DNA recombination protein RmuC [candidate division Zixibacteria bacterium]|nr:DNA recombination protein RmuC [candidate division Zixibacteria bacterium]
MVEYISIGLTLIAAILAVSWIYRALKSIQSEASSGLADIREQVSAMKIEALKSQAEQLGKMQEGQTNLSKSLSDQMEKSSAQIYRQLAVVPDIQKKLGELAEQARQIAKVGSDIGQLSDLLKPPKARGSLGEVFLINLLDQVFPKGVYEVEYSFRDKMRVDAVVRFSGSLIPIDSKFPLDSYRRMTEADGEEMVSLRKKFERDLKGHIDKVAGYIRVDENTTEYAIMYLPSEAVYAEAVSPRTGDSSLLEYSLSKHIIMASPSLMFAYLQTIAGAMRGYEVEERSKDILSKLGGLADRFSKFNEAFGKVGGALQTASNHFERARNQAGKFERDLEGLTGIEAPREIYQGESQRTLEFRKPEEQLQEKAS